MSQDYQQGIFSFSNGFERSTVTHHHQQQQHQHHHHHHHLAQQQIRRDNRGFEAPPPPLVGIEEEEAGGGLPPVYETAGMLSEMFNFPPTGATAAELLEQQHHSVTATFRSPSSSSSSRPPQAAAAADWYGSRQGMITGLGPLGDSKHHNASVNHNHPQISGINADSAAAMQLFLMNPPQTRSPSPPHSHATPPSATSSTLHMLLPNPSSNSLQGFGSGPGGSFGQFTWVPDSGQEGGAAGGGNNNPGHEISGGVNVVEGQGLSLSLSSSLQHLEAAKAEELRMGESGFLYYNQGGGGPSSSSSQYPYKNLGGGGGGGGVGAHHHQALHLQGAAMGQNHQGNVGFSSSSLGVVNVLRNSKYVKAAQELLEEFCSVGRGQFKKTKFSRQNSNPSSNPGGGGGGGGAGGGSSSSSKDPPHPPLSAADRIEHQRRKVKLLSMLDEACNLYFSLSVLLSPSLIHQESRSPNILFFLFIYSIN